MTLLRGKELLKAPAGLRLSESLDTSCPGDVLTDNSRVGVGRVVIDGDTHGCQVGGEQLAVKPLPYRACGVPMRLLERHRLPAFVPGPAPVLGVRGNGSPVHQRRLAIWPK